MTNSLVPIPIGSSVRKGSDVIFELAFRLEEPSGAPIRTQLSRSSIRKYIRRDIMTCVGPTQCNMSYLRGVWRNECAMQGLAWKIILSRNKISIANS